MGNFFYPTVFGKRVSSSPDFSFVRYWMDVVLQCFHILRILQPRCFRFSHALDRNDGKGRRRSGTKFWLYALRWLAGPPPKWPGVVGLRMQRNTRGRVSPLQQAFVEHACLFRFMGQ
jgi:hypothetical protein